MTDSMIHGLTGHDKKMAAEHHGALALLDPSDASHVALRSGNWSDANTWAGGKVPGEGADVHIPENIAVRYDVKSDASLHFVRVDGTLNWATNTDTKMLVDTVIGTGTSTLTIGTAQRPMNASVNAEIVFADNGRIDLDVDPHQLSRGFIAHGDIEVHGEAKNAYLAVATAPGAGDTTIAVEGDATGWSVGDKLVVMGVQQNGENARGQLLTQDEERTITAIKADGTIVLDRALDYDHEPPAGHGFDVYVGNQTRNITFSSENPEGVRGHVMVMHSGGADIRYAAFDDLGRTDVSEQRGTADNPEGRYPLHLHRTGVDGDMSMLVGNAVSGGPGWGIVQHESHAAVDYNFVYDVQGAGIVSETGNETGQWIGNFVTSIYGDGDKLDHMVDEIQGQFGHAGVAYENQSRLIIQQDNIASGSKYGWVFRASEIFEIDGSEELTLDRSTVQFDPDPTGKDVLGEEAQIMGFVGNEAIAVDVAFDSGHRVGITEETDLHSQIFDFTVWNSSRGIDLMNYTGNYVIKDSVFVNGFQAVALPDKLEGTNLIDVLIEGYLEGIVNYGYNSDGVLVDVVFKDTRKEFITRDGKPMEILDSADLKMLDAPIVKIDPGSDLLMQKGSEDDLFIKGTITDSAGTYGFAENRWVNQPHSISEGLTVRFNEPRFHTYEEAFDLHGTMQQADGSWVMPVVFWVSDRVTGQPHPVVVEIDVKGFDEAMLKTYEIDRVVLPSAEIEVIDTKIHHAAGHDAMPDDHDSAVEDPIPTPTAPVGPEPEPAPETPPAPVEPAPPVEEPDSGGSDPAPRADGQTVFEMAGTRTFDARAENVVNLEHDADLQIAGGTISLTFNATQTDRYHGILSKDATGFGDGGHVSVAVKNGALELRAQTVDGEKKIYVEGIEANRDYDLDLGFGEDGLWATLDDEVVFQDDEFILSWENNTEFLQIGALGKWSDAGDGQFGALFKGEISDVKIVAATDDPVVEPSQPDVEPIPAPPQDSGFDGFTDGTTIYAVERVVLDGTRDAIVNMAHDASFEQDNVHVSLTFNASTTNHYRGIFSKDATGFGDGGHVSAAIRNGVLELRAQTAEGEKKIYVEGIEANRDYDLDFGFSKDGLWATLDNEVVFQDDEFIVSWENNTEFLQIGALGKWSDPGADDVRAFFRGEISDVTISAYDSDTFLL